MKMKKASKIMALVLAVAMVIALLPTMMVSAATAITIGTIEGAINTEKTAVSFTVPYTLTTTESTDQITLLVVKGNGGVINYVNQGTVALPNMQPDNIAYIDQVTYVAPTGGTTASFNFVANVPTASETYYVTVGGTNINTPVIDRSANKLIEITPDGTFTIDPAVPDVTKAIVVNTTSSLDAISKIDTIELKVANAPTKGSADSKFTITAVDATTGTAVANAKVFYSVQRGKFVSAIPSTQVGPVKYNVVTGTTPAADVIPVYGDVDNTDLANVVDVSDILAAAKYDAAISRFSDFKTQITGDVNGDGIIDISDILDLAKLDAAIISSLAITNN